MNRYEEILNEVVSIINSGQKLPSHRMAVISVPEFTPLEVKQVRISAHMTQSIFAACIGVSKKSVEAWEGGRSKPDGAARRLIGLIRNDPDFAQKAGIYIDENLTTE